MSGTVETRITIDAPAQTIWSVMDDLAAYPEWNRLTTDLSGRTTVGSVVRGTLTKGGESPPVPLSPTITKIIGARELRWVSDAPGFRGEHYFILRPAEAGGTELVHNEDYSGPVADERWPGIRATSPQAFERMNNDLKLRAETVRDAAVEIHPSAERAADGSAEAGSAFELSCHCSSEPVAVSVAGAIYHNHLCGCSKCWKPAGALFAQTAVVASDGVEVRRNGHKLVVVDPAQAIARRACVECGVHMVGTVADPDHHFYGLAFIHPELLSAGAAGHPEFAGFVSSIIETGTSPSLMFAVRKRLGELGIPAYDSFSPELMDIIAWHKVKLARFPQPTT